MKKNTININGLPVEFTDQKPTRPGAYWAVNLDDEHKVPELIELTRVEAALFPGLDSFLWSSPLVPDAAFIKPKETLQDAAVAWWRSHRPIEYGEVEHLNNPVVNCSCIEDRQLAIAVAGLLASLVKR